MLGAGSIGWIACQARWGMGQTGAARFAGFLAAAMLTALAALAWPGVARAAEDVEQLIVVGPDNEIYGSQQAADLVAEARQFDPMFCPRGQADRDKAALLYEKAMAAQPGAKLNAPLADRVAQLYAFYADREKKVSPIRGKAAYWWCRCVEITSPRQLLWAQAQMGLASMGAIGRDRMSALARYEAILNMDVAQVELPDWQVWPDGKSEQGKALLEREQARLEESAARIQARAVEKQFYVLCRVDKSAALEALGNAAAKHRGTQAGERASDMMDDIRKRAGGDPWALPDLMTKSTGGQEPEPSPPHGHDLPKADPPGQALPAVAEASFGSYWGWAVAAFGVIGAALLATTIAWNGRRKQSIVERRAL